MSIIEELQKKFRTQIIPFDTRILWPLFIDSLNKYLFKKQIINNKEWYEALSDYILSIPYSIKTKILYDKLQFLIKSEIIVSTNKPIKIKIMLKNIITSKKEIEPIIDTTNLRLKNKRAQFERTKIEFKLIHNNLYDYSKSFYVNYKTKIVIICLTCDNEFMQDILKHKSGSGCPKCAITKRSKLRRYTQEQFLAKAKIEHGDKYNYDEVIYIHSQKKIIITCNNCNTTFKQLPHSHLQGTGCMQCATKKANMTRLIRLQPQWNIDMQITHLFDDNTPKYDYSEFVYVNRSTSGIIICLTCKKENRLFRFMQSPTLHINYKHQCHVCFFIKNAKHQSKPLCEFISKSSIMHKEKYRYDKVHETYISGKSIIMIFCIKCNKYFYQVASEHFRGSNCSFCHQMTSKPAREYLKYIQVKQNIILQTFDSDNGEYKIIGTRYKADGYHKLTNTVYEFLGDYYHGNFLLYAPDTLNKTTKTTMGELYTKTCKRKDKIIALKYNYVEIWESEWISFKKSIKLLQKRWKLRKISRSLYY